MYYIRPEVAVRLGFGVRPEVTFRKKDVLIRLYFRVKFPTIAPNWSNTQEHTLQCYFYFLLTLYAVQKTVHIQTALILELHHS